MKLTHFYFGDALADVKDDIDVYWEKEVTICDDAQQHSNDCISVEVWVWAGSPADLTPTLLDQFASLCQQLQVLDKKARNALSQYLQEDSSYIDSHRDEELTEDSNTIAALFNQATVTPEQFVEKMQLTQVGLWAFPVTLENEKPVNDSPMVMDYMIDSEVSDEILAVKLSIEGNVTGVMWES